MVSPFLNAADVLLTVWLQSIKKAEACDNMCFDITPLKILELCIYYNYLLRKESSRVSFNFHLANSFNHSEKMASQKMR